jgi:hypothetical protein
MTLTAYLWNSDLESTLCGWFKPANSSANARACTTIEIRNPEGPLRIGGGGVPNSTMMDEDFMTE